MHLLVSRDFRARDSGLVASPAKSRALRGPRCSQYCERGREARPDAPGDPRDPPSPAGACGSTLLSLLSGAFTFGGLVARSPPLEFQTGAPSREFQNVCWGEGCW